MIEQYSNNSFFQDNTVLDVVNDMSKDFGNFKNQLSTNQFNNVSQLETKLENVQQYIHYFLGHQIWKRKETTTDL